MDLDLDLFSDMPMPDNLSSLASYYDLIGFLVKLKNIDLPEAVDLLVEQAKKLAICHQLYTNYYQNEIDKMVKLNQQEVYKIVNDYNDRLLLMIETIESEQEVEVNEFW